MSRGSTQPGPSRARGKLGPWRMLASGPWECWPFLALLLLGCRGEPAAQTPGWVPGGGQGRKEARERRLPVGDSPELGLGDVFQVSFLIMK